MRKLGTNPNDVKMSDVLCDFCHREWTMDVSMIEGHQGSCICAKCLRLAWAEVIKAKGSTAPESFKCPMCLETTEDRKSLGRVDEPGWQSPLYPEAVICRRCIELAAKSLDRDPDAAGWRTG